MLQKEWAQQGQEGQKAWVHSTNICGASQCPALFEGPVRAVREQNGVEFLHLSRLRMAESHLVATARLSGGEL